MKMETQNTTRKEVKTFNMTLREVKIAEDSQVEIVVSTFSLMVFCFLLCGGKGRAQWNENSRLIGFS